MPAGGTKASLTGPQASGGRDMPAAGTKARLTGGGALLAEGSRLHGEVSKASATGRGDAVASIPNRLLGQGKRKIWAGAEPLAQEVLLGKGDGSSRGKEEVEEKDRGRIRQRRDHDDGPGSDDPGSGRKGWKKDRDESKKSREKKGKKKDSRDRSEGEEDQDHEQEDQEDQDRVERRLAKRAKREAKAEEQDKAARKAEKKAARKAAREEEDEEGAGEGEDECGPRDDKKEKKKKKKSKSKKRKHNMGEQGQECSGEDDDDDDAAVREKKERKAARKARKRHAEEERGSNSDGDDDGQQESKGEDKDSATKGSGKKKRKRKKSCKKKKKKEEASSVGAPSLPAPRPLPPLKLQPSALPAVEALRSSKVWKLHKQLEEWCYEASGAMPPALTFERWLLNGLPRRTSLAAAAAGTVVKGLKGPKPDPLLHAGEAARAASVHLIADLTRASIPLVEAQSIAEKLTAASTLAASDLAKTLKHAVNGAPAKIELVRHRHTIDIFIAGRDKRVLKLNHEHYDKLRAMWRLRKAGGAAAAAAAAAAGVAAESSGCGSAEEGWEEEFHASLFSMLQRYNSLQGHGFQAACPEQVQEMLKSRLGVTHECFASSLNAFFPSFCSAFLDTDAPFGSVGSFWDWNPDLARGGSFEANPPFVADVMLDMAIKFDALLAREAGAPLTFVVVVPGWLDDAGIRMMIASPFKRFQLTVPKDDHGFCDGAQHQRRDRYRASPYDTLIFVLQNDGAHAATLPPLTEGFGDQILDAFAHAKPTAAAVYRRLRDGRGKADEDGGGIGSKGYQGKKENRKDGVK